ncbi:A-kinase anchor protein 5 [Dasypus novemcinctus]|uniref:A-kinase anchor protein 5 n=1 Tax=Dasypus novemcinctus TaxID=9361 RepID=UPI00265F0CA2|nr:A-kinase anchor protein 5 [Dasypus novemcinctus]
MKKCSVNIETTLSEIQVENKDEKRSAGGRPQDERQEGKASMLCFKRRKKAAKAVKPKAGAEAADATWKHPPEAEASGQAEPLEGTWASIKRLVTRRKRSESSKHQKPFEAKVKPEINAEDADLSKEKAKSRLKIPCIKFSRGEKRSNHSKIVEDSDCSIKVQGEAEHLDTKTQTQSNVQATKVKTIQDLSEGISQKDGDKISESNVSQSISSPEEKMVSVELGLHTGHSAIQTGTLENDYEKTGEKQRIQHQQTSSLETSEEDHQLPVVSDVLPSSPIPDQQIVEETSNNILERGQNWKDQESREIVAEKSKPKDTEESTDKSDFKEIEIIAEKPKLEESKRMEPIAIIITDTEISEFDAKKSINVPKKVLISIENEQVGVFANDSGFEGRTSEQYETLLIETAASLVKNAIQLSVAQLINEMASDDKINNLLQ